MFKWFKKEKKQAVSTYDTSLLTRETKGGSKRSLYLVVTAALAAVLIAVSIGIVPQLKVSPKSGLSLGYAEIVSAQGGTLDWYFTGANDNTKVASAVAALPATGGEVFILTPATGQSTINFSGTVSVPANVEVRGSGMGSTIVYNGSSPCFTSTGNGTTYENLKVDAGSIDMGATTGWLWTNVAVGTTLYTERSPNSSLVDSTLNAPTGRTASYVIAASNYSGPAQYDQKLAGTNDQVAINAELVALNALGIKQKLTLLGDFTCNGQIVGKSNVDVECIGTITVNAADGSNAIYLQGVTNSVWTTVKAYRTGTSNNHNYTTGGCWVLIGACDRTLVLNHCEGYNQTTDAGYCSTGLTMTGGAGICSATVLGGYYQGGGTAAGIQNAGMVISLQLQGSPLLDSVYAKGGSGWWASGIIWEEETTGEIIGGVYKGGTGNGCCGGFFDNASGGIASGATFTGGDAGTECEGVQTYGNNTTAFNGCKIEAGKPYLTSINAGMRCSQSSAPIVTGGSIGLQSQGFVWAYAVANNGRFQPLPAGYIPRIVSLQIYVITGTSGATLDIGHSPTEYDVAQGIDISATGTSPVFTLQRECGDANGYFYVTPNKSIPEGSIRVYVTCLYDDIWGSTYSPAVIMDTTGYARFIGVDMLSASAYGTLHINDVTHKNWSMTGCQIENIVSWYSNTIEASAAITNVPIYLSTIKGLISANIISFAAGTPAGTNIQY